MLLIADSGSTKTDWRSIDKEGKIEQAKSAGFNPYYQTEEEIYRELETVLMPQLKGEIEEVFYYGAGCGTEEKCSIVRNAVQKAFPLAKVHITHDLEAAARALCNKEKGIACILGTGSNSCIYDGKEIIQKQPSLGFILGDEGSGAHMCKKLITGYLYKELPENLMEKFDKRYKTSLPEILDNIYKKPFPNRYLAGFSQFLFHNLGDPFIYKLVYTSFSEFFERIIMNYENYKDYKVHFVGSIAFYYSNILRQVANDKEIVVKNIMESPIAGLTLYHLDELDTSI